MPFRIILLYIISAILLAPGAARADVLWLTTGDRVSGEILKLEESKLSLKTSFAGTIHIDWKTVERIESEQTFEIEFDSGLNVEGRIEQDEGGLRIQTPEQAVEAQPEEVLRLEPAGKVERFWDIADLRVDFGFNLTRGNSYLRQSSLGVYFAHRTPTRRITTTLNSIASQESKDETRINRNEVDARLDRYFTKRFFAYGLGALESDEGSLLDIRLTGGGGIGYQIKKNRRENLSLLGGVNVVRERFSADGDTPGSRSTTAESMVGVEAERKALRGISLFLKASAHPSYQQQRYRLAGDAGVRVPILGFLTWSLKIFDRFDSKPPTEARKNDYGLVSALGFSF